MAHATATCIPVTSNTIHFTVPTNNATACATQHAFMAQSQIVAPSHALAQSASEAFLSAPNLSDAGSGTSSLSSGPPTPPTEVSDFQPMVVDETPKIPAAKTYADATNLAVQYPELASAILHQPLLVKPTEFQAQGKPHSEEHPNWALAGASETDSNQQPPSRKDRTKRRARTRGPSSASNRNNAPVRYQDERILHAERRASVTGTLGLALNAKPSGIRTQEPNSATAHRGVGSISLGNLNQELNPAHGHLLGLLNPSISNEHDIHPTGMAADGGAPLQLNQDQLDNMIFRAYTLGAQGRNDNPQSFGMNTLYGHGQAQAAFPPTSLGTLLGNPPHRSMDSHLTRTSLYSSISQPYLESRTGYDTGNVLPLGPLPSQSSLPCASAVPDSGSRHSIGSNSSQNHFNHVPSSESYSRQPLNNAALLTSVSQNRKLDAAPVLGASVSSGQHPFGNQADPMLSIFSPKLSTHPPRSFGASTHVGDGQTSQFGAIMHTMGSDNPNWRASMTS